MPITKSAKKAFRQSQKRRRRNLVYKKKIKEITKQIKNLLIQKKPKEAESLLPQLYKALDKAAKVGVIKKGAAARKKSCFTKLIKKEI